MNRINNTSELQAKISEMQAKSDEAAVLLKEELSGIVDGVHPVQLLKNGIRELVTSSEVKNELLGLSLAMSSGYMTKKLMIGNSNNIFQRIMGNVISVIVSKNIALNADKIQTTVLAVISSIMDRKKSNESAPTD
ncbi:MAG: hypothetical protein LAT54_07280 [Cryomorphaceae bacterium]|nr:hypothetical protein [Cryomorphaceae bacterium]